MTTELAKVEESSLWWMRVRLEETHSELSAFTPGVIVSYPLVAKLEFASVQVESV